MDIDTRMSKITAKLKTIVKYDIDGFLYDLGQLVNDLHFFHNKLIPDTDANGDNTFYRPKQRPKEHQIAYFNLGHNYPKELYGGHWCYILKDFKYKMLIIPTTSVKPDSSPLDPNFEIKIEADGFFNDLETRVQVSDMKVVDIQRLYDSKGFFDVSTNKEYIKTELHKIILGA